MPLQVGIVGLGPRWDFAYRPALTRLGQLFMAISVHDAVAHRARREAALLGCDLTEGFRALISRCDVEAVLLIDACWYGLQPLVAACQGGKPTLLAHSLAGPALDRPELVKLLDQCHATVEVALPWAWAPAARRLTHLIRERLGPPNHLTLRTHRSLPSSEELEDLIQRTITLAARLLERNLLELRTIRQHATGRWSVELHDGPTLEIVVSEEAGPPSVEVHTTHGKAHLQLPDRLRWTAGGEEHEEPLAAEPSAEEQVLKHFYDVAVEGVAPSLALPEALRLATAVRRFVSSLR